MDRNVQVIAQLVGRWSDERLEEARAKLYAYNDGELEDKIRNWLDRPGADPEVEILLRIPTFFEDLALLVDCGSLRPDLVWRAFAGPALRIWDYWEAAIRLMQKKDPGAYVEYERLTEDLRKLTLARNRDS